jgi:hypothetical protein
MMPSMAVTNQSAPLLWTHPVGLLPTKDHLPAVEATKVIQRQDSRSKQTTKCTRQRRHDDIQGQTVDKLCTTIPSRHVISNAREHACLEDTENKANTAHLGLVADESGEDGDKTETETGQGNKPARTHPFAEDICGDLENDVGDVEDGEDDVVVEVDETEVGFEACEARIAWGGQR